MPLKVTIIGGGLAGLLAGRFLREHHEVTIVERFAGGHELGAAINLAPSAVKILDSVGFSRERAGSINARTGRTYDEKGRKFANSDMSELCQSLGSDWTFQHRADLWHEFCHLATAPSTELGVSGDPAHVIWGGDVTDVDVQSGDVKLADGRVIQSDLVIAADGIKSIIRPLVVGEDAFRTARSSGSSAFRFTMPAKTVRETLPGLDTDRLLDTSQPACLDVHISLDGSNRSVVMYCCRNFDLVNFVCIAPDNRIKTKTTESWSAAGTTEDLVDTYHDFEYLKPLLSKANNIMLWQLRDQDPLPSYIKGRTVLIGDAAHAMTPHQGQGGTQAVEDAEAFCLFNNSAITREMVPETLKDWDGIRRPRASAIQNNTRDSQARTNPETLYQYTKFNWTYPGAVESLNLLKCGQQRVGT